MRANGRRLGLAGGVVPRSGSGSLSVFLFIVFSVLVFHGWGENQDANRNAVQTTLLARRSLPNPR